MQTITITRKKTIEEKTEIELPAYFKNDSDEPVLFYKVFSADQCLQIFNESELSIKDISIAIDEDLGNVASNESEFKQAYEKALTLINSKL